MINWNITDARQVERITDLDHEDDEQTVVHVRPAKLASRATFHNETNVRAIALLVATVLTVIVAVWQNPEALLWWLIGFLAVSAWCCALGAYLIDILRVAVAWIVEAFAYLRGLFASWRDAAKHFIDRWIWSRFRKTQIEGGGYVHH